MGGSPTTSPSFIPSSQGSPLTKLISGQLRLRPIKGEAWGVVEGRVVGEPLDPVWEIGSYLRPVRALKPEPRDTVDDRNPA